MDSSHEVVMPAEDQTVDIPLASVPMPTSGLDTTHPAASSLVGLSNSNIPNFASLTNGSIKRKVEPDEMTVLTTSNGQEQHETDEEDEIIAQSLLTAGNYSEPQPEVPPKSAYVMWMTEEMHKEKAVNKDFSFAKFSRECGERWKQLDESTRSEWEKRYAERQIEFWWALAKWGESTGQSAYVKKRPSKKQKKGSKGDVMSPQ